MKKVIILSSIIVIMAGAAACASGTPNADSPSPGNFSVIDAVQTTLPQAAAPITEPPPAGGTSAATTVPALPAGTPGAVLLPHTGRENVYSVQIDLIPDKLVYGLGEPVRMKLILTNASQGKVEPVVVSQLPPIVSLVPAAPNTDPTGVQGMDIPGSESSRAVKVFTAGIEEKTLAKGEKVTYDLTWDQKDENGKLVSPGWYYYESNYYFRRQSTQDYTGSGLRDRAFLIQYPQGAMQKNIELNQSRTITGLPLKKGNETRPVDITVNLQRIELNEKGATFYAVMTSPNNPVSGYNNIEWAGCIPMSSQYIIDGVVKEARAPNSRFLDSGIEFRWGASADDDNYLDPVPADAKTLTFVIPEIRPDWKGPWEFRIPLGDEPPFKVVVSTEPAHLPGEPIVFGIGITNLSSDAITIDPFPPARWIKPVGQDKAVYSSPAGTRSYDIGAGQHFLPTKGTWDQKDNNGQQVAPGWYEIGYEYVIIEPSTGKRYAANPTARFQIVDSDSSMKKNMEVNRSVTAEGVTVSLKSIEMNAVETKVYTFTTPQGYTLPQPQEHPSSEFESLMTKSIAEYCVDGGIIKQVKSDRGKADADGITLIWDNIDPMPVDAKEITFTITRLGDLQGRWEFKIQLN